MSKEILKLENVEKKYSGSVEELHIINNLSFSVEEENLYLYLDVQVLVNLRF